MLKQLSLLLHRPPYVSLAWVGAGALVLAIAAAWYLLPLQHWLETLRGWLVGLGLTGVIIFVVIYIVGAVVLAPAGLLSIVAGFAYGFWALPIVVVAATLGAAAAFVIARYLARERVRLLLQQRRELAA